MLPEIMSIVLESVTSRFRKRNIEISMSRKGNPYDNAFAESFIKTLKVEEVYLNEYGTFEDAIRNIRHFIEKVYNKKRLHSALGCKSPEQFEMEAALNTVASHEKEYIQPLETISSPLVSFFSTT